MSTPLRIVVTAGLVVGAASCTRLPSPMTTALVAAEQAPANPLAPAAAISAQSFKWKLELRGIELAKMTLEARPVAKRPGLVSLISTVRTSGVGRFVRHVERRTITVVSAGVPVSAWAFKGEQSVQRRVHTRFEPGVARVVTDRGSSSDLATRPSRHGDTIYNGETALAALRAWRPADGDVAEMVALAETRHWWVRFRARRGETMSYRGARHATIAVDGVMRRMNRRGVVESERRPQRMTLWLTDDEQRLPLRIEFTTKYGKIKARLE